MLFIPLDQPAQLRNLTITTIIITTIVLVLVRFAVLAVYRVFFHPNANIPGPLLGRITNLYEYYHEIIKGEGGELNKYAREVLHPQYGPIIRTAPDRVRIADKNTWFKVHSVGYLFNVDPAFPASFGSLKSFFANPNIEYHRRTRTILTSYFTKRAALEAQGVIHEKLETFIGVLEGLAEKGEKDGSVEINFRDGYACLLTDFITEYVFETNWNTINSPSFHHPIADLNHTEFPPFRRAIPYLLGAIQRIPPWLSRYILPERVQDGIYLRRMIHEKVGEFAGAIDDEHTIKKAADMERGENEPKATTGNIGNGLARKLIGKLTLEEVGEEAALMFGAGVNSTGWMLCSIMYGIVATEGAQERLFSELKDAFPNRNLRMNYECLKDLPYLTACIKEGMRYNSATPGNLPRVAPSAGTTLCGYNIAPGTIIETNINNMLLDPSTFPQPSRFIPERWIPSETPFPDAPENLDKFLVPFSSGSRMCLGYNLAWMLLYCITSRVVREFVVELGEGLKRDGEWRGVDRWTMGKRGDPGVFVARRRRNEHVQEAVN